MAMFTSSLPRSERASHVASWRLSFNLASLLAFAAGCGAVAAVSATFVETAPGSWYHELRTPSFAPAPHAFATAGFAVAAAQALGAWLVWRRAGPEPDRSRALVVFGVVVLLGGLWPAVFFGAEVAELSMLVAAASWLAVLAMVLTFAAVDPWAALLAVPVLAWVTLVAVTNGAILVL